MKANTILETIGRTPHVRIQRIFGPDANVWVKCERANPGGSIKDRIALEDHRAVLAALWEVAYADNSRGADEDSLIRLVSSLLGMTDRESAEIRQHVLARIGLEP